MDNDIKPSHQNNHGVHHPPTGASLPPARPEQRLTTPTVTPLPVSETPSGSKKPKKEHGILREILSTFGILGMALLIALLMIGFVFRSYQVDGPSMQQTLQNGDKLIIWKVPRTWSRITHHAYIPNRGDIIIFSESGLAQYGQIDTKQLIKRVIALPGERVIVTDGHYIVYNKTHPEGFDPDKSLPYGKNMPVTSASNLDVTLSKDQLFVSGDNRPDSLDSRAFGPINANQVIGKLALRVFPISQAKGF